MDKLPGPSASTDLMLPSYDPGPAMGRAVRARTAESAALERHRAWLKDAEEMLEKTDEHLEWLERIRPWHFLGWPLPKRNTRKRR